MRETLRSRILLGAAEHDGLMSGRLPTSSAAESCHPPDSECHNKLR